MSTHPTEKSPEAKFDEEFEERLWKALSTFLRWDFILSTFLRWDFILALLKMWILQICFLFLSTETYIDNYAVLYLILQVFGFFVPTYPIFIYIDRIVRGKYREKYKQIHTCLSVSLASVCYFIMLSLVLAAW